MNGNQSIRGVIDCEFAKAVNKRRNELCTIVKEQLKQNPPLYAAHTIVSNCLTVHKNYRLASVADNCMSHAWPGWSVEFSPLTLVQGTRRRRATKAQWLKNILYIRFKHCTKKLE